MSSSDLGMRPSVLSPPISFAPQEGGRTCCGGDDEQRGLKNKKF